ncbi:MAG: cupin domain-containing protein [Pseudomonadota bacterium]
MLSITRTSTLRMTTIKVLTSFLLFFSFDTYAIENSASVKVTPVLKTTTSWNGTLLKYPEGQAEISGMLVEIAPDGTTGWHLHPVPSFGMLLEGTLEVTLKDGRTLIMHEGDSLAEVANTLHSGKNIGKKPVKILVFYAGAVGIPLSIKENTSSNYSATLEKK